MSHQSKCIEATLHGLISESLSRGIQAFGQDRIQKWVIRRGMEFQSPWIWWGDPNKTRQESYGGGPHEGIDFALGEMKDSKRIQAGMAGLQIPAFTEGTLHWTFPDLVGDTAIVVSDKAINGQAIVFQYSHIELDAPQIGDRLSQGDAIGKIAQSQNPKSITASHLHLSVALIEQNLLERPNHEVDFNNWLEWEQLGQLTYFDPLELLSPEIKETRFVLGQKANSPFSRLVSTGATKEMRLELRRTLSLNFPGVQALSKKTLSEASAHQTNDSLLINRKNGTWEIQPSPSLEVPSQTCLEGDTDQKLVDTLCKIETANKTFA
ncbi:hypothetical protein [Pelagicoccus mobilis]|uniref:Peptidase M23 domain-containing protein n=1 Tax=Pelagicoccus mobilis TaxID=415221 RepID=A0A934VP55_9BACT|nr:hypothetical protein [Pelagicoccus mobilis]MBK1875465.1 hypothetical protein [Pelagicoccus mobilis]